jgi:hypothetical protein
MPSRQGRATMDTQEKDQTKDQQAHRGLLLL